ncbi:hypothetical protein SERLADRAFT_377153, partial [Serpula lacrymans var. lacrymans S7.9]
MDPSQPRALRRSSRNVNKAPPRYQDASAYSSYPDTAPSTDFEKMMDTLNKQAYTSDRYGAVDDAMVYALFDK